MPAHSHAPILLIMAIAACQSGGQIDAQLSQGGGGHGGSGGSQGSAGDAGIVITINASPDALPVAVNTSLCGNGVLDPGEQCDDGVPSARKVGSSPVKSSCQPRCGDGVVTGREECDCGDGTVPVPAGCPGANNDTTYGGCTTQCKWGPFCGDNMVQNPPEECDLGKNNGDTSLGSNGCTFACKNPHFCGDSFVDTELGERCDLGANNGVTLDTSGNPSSAPDAKIYCDTKCQIPPAIIQ